MNELQQVLLIFSIIVIAGLYFLSRSRQNSASSKPNTPTAEPQSSGANAVSSGFVARSMAAILGQTVQKSASTTFNVKQGTAQTQSAKHTASEALNELGEPHIPLSRSTEERLHIAHESLPEVNPNQLSLPLGEEFELPGATHFNPVNVHFNTVVNDSTSNIAHQPDTAPTTIATTPSLDANNRHNEVLSDAVSHRAADQHMAGSHYVLQVDDPGLNGSAPAIAISESEKPSFGIPKDKEGRSPGVSSGVKKNHEIYVLLVLSGATDFAMVDVNQALLGVGLSFSPKLIYVKNDTMGGEIIRIANLLEPGTFPTEHLANFTTPGIAMILELPTTVRAPRAMDDLIMMGRKVSQRLNGRLYNMERQLIKESDLQAMREAAIAYESSPL